MEFVLRLDNRQFEAIIDKLESIKHAIRAGKEDPDQINDLTAKLKSSSGALGDVVAQNQQP